MMQSRRALKVWFAGLVMLTTLAILVGVGSAQSDHEPALPPLQGGQAAALATNEDTEVSSTMPLAKGHIYLPLIPNTERPPTTLPFEDTFDQGLSSDWVVFLNYPGLTADDWYWDGQAPTWGFYVYNYDQGSQWPGFALSMYLGPGSDEWTDYEIVATLKKTLNNEKLGGLWFRGGYEESSVQGGQVGGYYVHIKPRDDSVYLWRIDPNTLQYQIMQVVAQSEYAPGITKLWYNLKVRVQGANIKVWLKQQVEPESAYVLLIDWTDPSPTYMQGTVGFSTFRTSYIFDDIKVTALSTSTQ